MDDGSAIALQIYEDKEEDGFRFQVSGFGCQEYRMPVNGYQIPDTGYQMLDAACWQWIAGCEARAFRFGIWDCEFRIDKIERL